MSFSRTVFQTTVFSNGPGGGNPCPVVLDADGLSTQQGMSLAEKFMAETVFVSSARTPQASLGLRYFVPRHEMNMCVHGTIAAVKVLHDLKKITTSPVQIETTMGRISAEWSEDNENIIVTVNQFAPAFSATNPTAQEVAKVLRLPDTSSIRVDLPLVSVSTSPISELYGRSATAIARRGSTRLLQSPWWLTVPTPQGSFRNGSGTSRIPQQG
jgi:PhzF family phenazine biosynthesis protein